MELPPELTNDEIIARLDVVLRKIQELQQMVKDIQNDTR